MELGKGRTEDNESKENLKIKVELEIKNTLVYPTLLHQKFR